MDDLNLTKEEEQLSKELANALTTVYLNSPNTDFEITQSNYFKIRNEYVDRLKHNSILQLEVKRRVAEMNLYSAMEKEMVIEVTSKLLIEISELGFTNLEKKSTVQIIFSRYCYDNNLHETANILLTNLRKEIVIEKEKNDIELYQELLETIDKLLGQNNPFE